METRAARKLSLEEHVNRQNGSRYNKWNRKLTLGGIRQSKAWWADLGSDIAGKKYRAMYNVLNSYTNRIGVGGYANSWDAVLSAFYGGPSVKKMTKEEIGNKKKEILEVAKEKIKVHGKKGEKLAKMVAEAESDCN
jgi:hypothetical protein